MECHTQEKRRMHHEFLRRVFIEIQELQKEGGISTWINSKLEKIWPVLCLVITDEPEAQLCTLIKACRICMCPKSEFDDADADHSGKCTYLLCTVDLYNSPCLYADRDYVTTERKRNELMTRIETKDGIGEAQNELTENGITQGRLCCEQLGLRMGDAPQQWYGLFPSDRMHLWWEGIAKHMLTWLCNMIKVNFTEGDVEGSIRDFDLFVMQINTRHSDHTMPTFHFNSGVSELKGIPASRMIPLWIQIQVVLGCTNAFLTSDQHGDVHTAISMLLDLGHSLHVLQYSESDVKSLELQIRRFPAVHATVHVMSRDDDPIPVWDLPYQHSRLSYAFHVYCRFLRACKAAFAGMSRSDFKFAKFHNTLHCGWAIRRFGAMWVFCSGRFEHFHKILKLQYASTSKRTKSFMREMIMNLRLTRVLAMVRVHRPVLSRVPSRMQEIDPCTSRMVGDHKTVNVYIGLNEQQSELPFSSAIYSEVQSGSASADSTLTLLKFQGALKAYLKDHLFYDHKPAGPSIANAMTRVHVHSGCRYAHADGKQVFVRASESFQNNTPWHDAAIVQYDVDEGKQLAYARVYLAVECSGQHLLFVRWYTSASRADASTAICNAGPNEFESHHIRNLPQLKWNRATQNSNRSFQMLPASSLWKAVWVQKDFHDDDLWWHMKSTRLHMHQDPSQAVEQQ
jgi:hypothetical protein